MKKIIIALLSCFLFTTINAQTQTIFRAASAKKENLNVIRSISDKGVKGMNISYSFNGLDGAGIDVSGTLFTQLAITHFTNLKEIGKPSLPAHYDIIIVPQGAQAEVVIKKQKSVLMDNILAYPALRPATDRYGDPEPEFTIDSAFYSSSLLYPEKSVQIIKTLKIRDVTLAIIQICPVQYNPAARKIILHTRIDFAVKFNGASKYISQPSQYSNHFMNMLPNYALNNQSLKNEIATLTNNPAPKAASSLSKNYIIVTHDSYLQAADSLAKWKAQLGYSVEIVSRSSWTSAQVKSEIRTRYLNWEPKPDYFVILGDVDKIPGEIHQDPSNGDNFQTDLYYACMNGSGDYVADMAFGRISVANATQALSVVNKIINYEKNPPSNAAFYTSALNCAQFQDDNNNNCEDRRFTLTSENIRTYMMSLGFDVTRVYKTSTSITPLYYNDGYYANSEPVPNDLLKPGFAWDGDKNDIAAEINASHGTLYVLHRDHGYSGGTGWSTPQFLTTDIDMLNNGNLLPVVFSINCHTGEYQLTECFSERFLRKDNGGAVGVFGAAYYSYSGYNDGLAIGFFDAIWANPGLIPNFTGSGDNPQGSPSAHQPIYTMGDVLNQGLIRMVQTWGDDDYTHELFHYFGDPAMKMWTALPTTFTATHTNSLNCGDTILHVFSSGCPDGLATLVVDGELYASETLNAGVASLSFAPVYGSEAILTISKPNYRPYIQNIPFTTACLKPDFSIAYDNACIGQNITYNSTSTGNILTYSWNFGADATPATATTAGPHNVTYSSPGYKIISLTLTDSTSSATKTDTLFISQPCEYIAGANQKTIINACQGVLLDNGGYSNYLAGSNDTIIITAPGASTITLNFSDFDVEAGSGTSCNYDYLEVFNGPSMASPLIGKYCNTTGNTPPAVITSAGNSITLRFYSDQGTNLRGFIIDFICNTPNSQPVTAFVGSPLSTCTGSVQFTDLSANNPTAWLWNFGDGHTSNLQDPVHNYIYDGIYTVSLNTSNTYGNNTFTRTAYVNVDKPDAPQAGAYSVCDSGSVTLAATGDGTLHWYDSSGIFISSGDSLTTPILHQTTDYFVESEVDYMYAVNPPDTSLGGGSYYTGSNTHYLVFNALQDLTLLSADVYSGNTGNKTFTLSANSGATILHDTTLNITAGKNVIHFNWPVPAGSAYRLTATASSSINLYRNYTGASFPYTINGVISVTGTSYTNPAYYYYFYNLNVSGGTCISERATVTVNVDSNAPTAAYSYVDSGATIYFSNQSQNAVSYFWDFDDGASSTLENPVHTYGNIGTYYVDLTVQNGCGSDVYTDTVYIYSVGSITETSLLKDLLVYPNPVSQELNIDFHSKAPENITMTISDMPGKLIMAKEIKTQTGNQKISINTSLLSQGVYFLKIAHGKESVTFKVIKY